MADPVSIIASAITIGASAAQLSLALFSVVQTLKNAPKEIADIAEEISLLAESLQTLADIIRVHQNLCKPALFRNTHSIILRYKQVDQEINKLIDTPQKLAGLKWLINKPKAKGLLKKVEGIKTALILELNIVRLAREETIRPPEYSKSDPNAQAQSIPKFNRFRKIVESAVQANRQVVESAQQEDDNSEAGKRHYTTAEIDVWREGSFDTATWLYNFVFRSDDASPPPVANPRTRRLHQASVSDESAEMTARSTHSSSSEADTTPNRRSSGPDEKAMIVWSRQTEPALVVDKLLSAWTTLTSDEIRLSSTRHDGDDRNHGDNWREGVLRMVEEAKKEDELSFDQWEQQNEPVRSDDDEFQSAEEDSTVGVNVPAYNFRNNAQSARKRNAKPFNHTDRLMDTYEPSPAYSDARPRRDAHKPHVTWQTTPPPPMPRIPTPPPPPPPIRRNRPRPSLPKRHTEKPRSVDVEDRSSASRIHTILSDHTDSGYNAPSQGLPKNFSAHNTNPAGYPNPFRAVQIPPHVKYEYIPPWQEPSQRSSVPLYHQEPLIRAYGPTDPYWSYPPPSPSPPLAAAAGPPPPKSPQSAEVNFNVPDTEAKEKAVIAAVEELLKRRNQESQAEHEEARFSRLAQILTVQQEREVQSERDRANVTTEVFIKQMQDAHKKDEERMRQLESLVADERAEQQRKQVKWEEEKKELEAKAARQAEEIRTMAAQEIAAAQLAKETAQTALNAGKLEAEKKARERADARVVEEKKRADDAHKLQAQRYEELLRELQEQQLRLEQGNDRPIRRTRIAEGNRSVDVTEYLTSKRNPSLVSSSSPLQNNFGGLDMRLDTMNDYRWSRRASRHDSFRSPAASLQSSRTSLGSTSTSNTNSKYQQMIVFPYKADRHSPKMAEAQTSLARFGIDYTFEDSEELYPLAIGQLIPYNHDESSDQVVRSTVFWEPSALRLGSELLLTMRQAGWRPNYTRISGKGQTHFLGPQPVHSYFFSPDYEPQFCPSTKASANESITIQKALVEEYALIEQGFEFRTTEAGVYILDGKLTYSDIETLIERSFLIKENNYRRLHRRLQWHYDKDPEVPLSAYPETYAPSLPSASSVYSGENSVVCDGTDTETQGRKGSTGSDADESDISDVTSLRVPCSEGSRRSVAPSSVASRTSKSTNPWGKYMKVTEDTGINNASGLSGSASLID